MNLLASIKTASTTLYHEFSSPLFDTVEPSFPSSSSINRKSYRHRFSLEEIRASSPQMDLVSTFSPSLWAVPVKFVMMGGSIAALVLDVMQEPSVWWLAYFENWVWCSVLMYFLASFVACVKLATWPRDDAGLLVKSAWALFAIALPLQILQSLMHYKLQFDGSFTYLSIIKNGANIPLLLIDGLVVNRIPLRMKQFGLSQFIVIAYLAWSLAYAFSALIMPAEEESIYNFLDWKNDIHSAILLSLFVTILVNPAVFLSSRAVSRILPRRLRSKASKHGSIVESSTADAQDEVDVTHDIEEGDVSCEEEKVDVMLNDVTIGMPSREEVVANSEVSFSTQKEEIENIASFPEMIYDDSEADVSLGSSYNEETKASSRIDSYIGNIETKKPYEDLASFADNDDDGNETDYSFEKEGFDISFEKEVSKSSLDIDDFSFPDLLPP